LKNSNLKWSQHVHLINDPNNPCCYTTTCDENWKVQHAKCLYEKYYTYVKELNKYIRHGCMESPIRGSYYCSKHNHEDLIFNVGKNKKSTWHPNRIIHTHVGNLNYNKKSSRGIQLAATNCGIVLGYRDLYGAEILTQVALFFLDIYDNFKIFNYIGQPKPQYFLYDNACNLKRYLKRRINKHSTDRMKNMKNIRFVVDKLHMAGHKEDWCKLHCDPARFPDLLK
jgi:hypothetical protein